MTSLAFAIYILRKKVHDNIITGLPNFEKWPFFRRNGFDKQKAKVKAGRSYDRKPKKVVNWFHFDSYQWKAVNFQGS